MTLVDGLGKKYLVPLDIAQMALRMFTEENPEKKPHGSDLLIAYGSALVPVGIYTFSKRLITGYPTGGRLSFLGKVAFETLFYPKDIVKLGHRFREARFNARQA